MDTIKDLLKGSNPVVILLLIFLIWQVTNHIPTQINRLEDKISKLEDKIDQVLIHLVKESK